MELRVWADRLMIYAKDEPIFASLAKDFEVDDTTGGNKSEQATSARDFYQILNRYCNLKQVNFYYPWQKRRSLSCRRQCQDDQGPVPPQVAASWTVLRSGTRTLHWLQRGRRADRSRNPDRRRTSSSRWPRRLCGCDHFQEFGRPVGLCSTSSSLSGAISESFNWMPAERSWPRNCSDAGKRKGTRLRLSLTRTNGRGGLLHDLRRKRLVAAQWPWMRLGAARPSDLPPGPYAVLKRETVQPSTRAPT